MADSSLHQRLRALDVAHRSDGDGGYELVRTVASWAESLSSEDRDRLRTELLDLVAAKDSMLWGVALEVLVEEGTDEVAAELSRLATGNDWGEDWNDQLVLALLRLGHVPSAEYCVRYVERALSGERRTALPLLAALCRVDVDACLRLSAAYFEGALASEDDAETHRGYIPAFVRNFVEVDDSLLWRVIERTSAAAPRSSARLAAMIDDCLGRPWISRELGDARVARLRERIRGR